MNVKKVLPIAITLIIGIALGSGGTIVVQKSLPDKSETEVSAAKEEKEQGPVVELGEFTVNLRGGSFLKTTIAVEGSDRKAEEILHEKEAHMKDRVNTVLSDQTLADVQTSEAREELRQELIEELNEVSGGKVQNVLFLTFVYQ